MGELPGQETMAAPAARRGALGVITAPNPDTITRVAAAPLMSELNVCVPTAPGPPGRSR
jgi:hypothetical protein